MSATEPSPAKRRFYWRYIDSAQHTGHTLWDWSNRVTQGYTAYLAQALKNFFTTGTTEAVVFGYWAMFSLFPLVMLGVVLATFALGPASARAQVYQTLNQYVPGGGGTLIRENIELAINQHGSFGLVGLIASSSTTVISPVRAPLIGRPMCQSMKPSSQSPRLQ